MSLCSTGNQCLPEGSICAKGKQMCCDGATCERLSFGVSAAETVYVCRAGDKLKNDENCSKHFDCESGFCQKNCRAVERLGISCDDVRGKCAFNSSISSTQDFPSANRK